MKIYFFESGNTCFSREVTVAQRTNCTLFSTVNLPNNGYQSEYRVTYRFTLDTPAPVDILVNWSRYEVHDSDVGGPSYEAWVDGTTLIPAGVTIFDIEQTCKWITYEDFGGGGMGLETMEVTDFKLLDQVTIPESCLNVDPNCNLEITSVTVTNPTLRGETNGSIAITVSGNTALDMTYRLNGVTITTSGSTTGYTFTDLGAGSYVVAAIDGDCGAQETVVILDGEFRTGDFTVLSPAELCAVENPVILNLSTAVNSSTPVTSINSFRVFSNINDGDYIEFNLTYPIKYTAKFIAKEFPDRDTYFLASKLSNEEGVQVGNNTIQEIVTSLVESIQKDAILSQLYYIRVPSSPTNTYFYLESKEKTNMLDLTTDNVNTQGNIIVANLGKRAGVSAWDGQLSANYSLYAEVYVNENLEYGATTTENTFKRVSEIELPFSSDNIHRFDVSTILKNFVKTPKLFFGQTDFSTIAPMMSSYFLRYGEKYPLIANSQTKKKRVKGQTDVKYVINSALDWEQSNTMQSYLGSKLSYLNPDFTFIYDDVAETVTIYDAADNPELTNVQYSLWDSEYDSIIINWQNSNVFNSVPVGQFGVRVSGTTNNLDYTVERKIITGFYGGIGQEITSIPIANAKFLTASPIQKFIERNSSEFLYFILKRNFSIPLKVKGDLYFYDGSTELGVDLYDITTDGNNYGGVFCLAAGYQQLNLAQYEISGSTTRKIRRLDFAVYQTIDGNDVPYTEVRTYRFEIDEMPRKYGVCFLNKLGTWDIFDFKGEIIESIGRDAKMFSKPRQIGHTGASPLGFEANAVYDTKAVRTIKANTGWINKEHFEWLLDLLASNKIYSYTEEEEPFLMVMEYDYNKSSNDDLFNIDVTFIETLQENNISV